MKRSDTDIYTLVDQLSKTERRFFDLDARKHVVGEENNYFKLYQLIRQKNIDKDESVLGFSEYGFVRYLSTAKVQLLQQLLNSLARYDLATNSFEQQKRKLHQVQILLSKGLITKAKSLLKRTQKTIEDYEFFVLIPEVIMLQQKIITQSGYANQSSSDLENVVKMGDNWWVEMQNYNEYWLLFSKIYKIHLEQGSKKGKNSKEKLQILFDDKMLLKVDTAMSISAKILFLQLKALQSFIENNPKGAAHFNQEILTLLERQPKILETNPQRYLSVLNNYVIDCLLLNEKSKFKAGLNRLRELPGLKAYKKLPNTKVNVFRLSYQLELNSNISAGRFYENKNILPIIEEGLMSFKKDLTEAQNITFYYLLTYAYLAMGEFNQSLDWSTKIINETSEKVGSDLQASARLLNLIAHYELGNFELLEYAITNVRRYHKRREKLYKLESLILSALSALIRSLDADRPEIFEKLRTELVQLRKENKDVNLFNNFNYPVWVTSKVQEISFQHAFKLSAFNE